MEYLCNAALSEQGNFSYLPEEMRPCHPNMSDHCDPRQYIADNGVFLPDLREQSSYPNSFIPGMFYQRMPLPMPMPRMMFDPRNPSSSCNHHQRPNYYYPQQPHISVNLVQSENGIQLVPSGNMDAAALVEIAKGSTVPKQITISLMPGIYSVDSNIRPSAGMFCVPNSSRISDPPKYSSQPKHIYRTSSDTYRVQVGKGLKTERNGKFSRNAQSEIDALWLCELALIIIDNPPDLETVIRTGNYKCLLRRGMLNSADDYVIKLVYHADKLRSKGLFKEHECVQVVRCFQKLIPAPMYALLATKSPSLFALGASSGEGEVEELAEPSHPAGAMKKRRRSMKAVDEENVASSPTSGTSSKIRKVGSKGSIASTTAPESSSSPVYNSEPSSPAAQSFPENAEEIDYS